MLPLLTLLVLFSIFNPSITLPGGAPPSVCNTMLPFHGGGIAPLTSVSPFRVTPFASTVGQGQVLQLQIESNPPNIVFGGFMLQARNSRPPYQVVGQFENSDEELIKLIDCDGDASTATHVSPAKKKDLRLEWISPDDFVGEVVFNATIAQEYDKFWVGLESTPVKIVAGSQAPQTTGGISTTRRPITTTVPSYVPTTEAVKDDSDPIYVGCGDTKGCFGFPSGCVDNKNCRAVVATTVQGERYTFEMKSGYDRPAYVAVGLSRDNKMGDDSVIECVPEQGNIVNAYSSWTTSGPYGVSRDGIPQNYFKVLERSYVDGVIRCKFERDAMSIIKGERFDLVNDKYHLLLATGHKADAVHVSYHDIGKEVSGEPRTLAEVSIKGKSKLLLRLHGCFMLTAWIGTASLGILLARYFKSTWVGSQLCGKDQWFAWHRFLMVVTWLLTMAGFIIIFVEIGGWSQVRNPHAILGTVTTVLCFLQPIGAFFRPHPGSKRRPLFNWVHWLGGNLAHIIGIVAIFFAVKLQKAELPEWLDFIIVAFVAFHVFMHLIFSIAGCASDRRTGQRVNSFPMADMTPSRNSMSSSERKQDAPFSGFRKILLFFYIIIVLLFVAALVSIAALAPIADTVESIRSQIMSK